MFAVGDLIVYSGTGVCRVENVGPPPFAPKEKRAYYTLVPLRSRETIYVPVDTQVFMRPILAREEAEKLIDRLPSIQEAQVKQQDYRALAQRYKEFLDTHRCEDLVQLIKAGYWKTQQQSRTGNKPSKVDQEFRKRAETLLHDELAAALEIPLEQVSAYIEQRLGVGPQQDQSTAAQV